MNRLGDVLLLDNPTAGGGRRRGLPAAVAAALAARNVRVMLEPTAGPAEAFERVAEAARSGAWRAVALAGGDGTIAPAAAALAGSALPFAVIPTGSANILALDLGLPRDAEGLARLIMEGRSRPLSWGRANGAAFLVVAGAGIDGSAAMTGAALKGAIGRAAYWTGIAGASLRRWPRLSVEIDGTRRTADWALAGNARLAPGSLLTFGGQGLRIALMSGGALARGPQLAAIAASRLASAPATLITSFTRATIHAADPAPAQADGAPIGTTPLILEAAALPVQILAP
jgi:diacylglycerol kinase family enzyme